MTYVNRRRRQRMILVFFFKLNGFGLVPLFRFGICIRLSITLHGTCWFPKQRGKPKEQGPVILSANYKYMGYIVINMAERNFI